MSGTEIFGISWIWPIAVISGVAAVMDLLRGRVYNWFTFPLMLAGIVVSALMGGWGGAGVSLLGILAGFLLFGWMFWFGAMGGGDVKLLMALGAWGGWRYATDVAVLSVLIGGVIALSILLVKGRLPRFLRMLHRFLLTLFVKELETETPKIDWKLTFPYAVPIAVAAVWVAVDNPLIRWGMRLW